MLNASKFLPVELVFGEYVHVLSTLKFWAKNQKEAFMFFYLPRWDKLRILGPEDISNEEIYIPIETEFVENLWVPDMYLRFLSELEVINFLIPFSGFLKYNDITKWYY